MLMLDSCQSVILGL